MAQILFGGLKALGALLLGSAWGLLGSFAGAIAGITIGFAVGGPIGAAIGGVVGFYSGGLFGTSLGSFIGWNWLTIASIPAAAGALLFGPTGVLGGGLTGASAASLANTTALLTVTSSTIIPAAVTHHHLTTISAAFSQDESSIFLPEYGAEYGPGASLPTADNNTCDPTSDGNDIIEQLFAQLPPANSIVQTAYDIITNLEQGFWCLWNKSPDFPELFDPSKFTNDPFPDSNTSTINMFWCTWLVMKAYQANGHDLPYVDADGNTLLNSQIMQDYFDEQGYFTPNSNQPGQTQTVISQVQPGDVIFIKNTSPGAPNRTNHVGIVYHADEDGVIVIDSNNSTKTTTYTVNDDGTIQDYGSLQVVGFGSHEIP